MVIISRQKMAITTDNSIIYHYIFRKKVHFWSRNWSSHFRLFNKVNHHLEHEC